jgi:class 3 adenylate cyclase
VKTSRRLAALMFTDMVGYSALAREDESMARELVDDQRVIVREALKLHDGRELQTTGDGFFIEFASAVNAVECAVRIQTELHEKSRYLPEDRRIKIRIGIHIGDILSNDEDLYGNSVNIAARIEPMARPGGICITRQVYEQVNEKIEGIDFKQVGKASLKNIRGGADIYHVLLPHEKVNHKSSPRFSNAWRRFQQFRQQTSFVQFNKASLFTSTLASLFLLSFAIAGGLMNVFNGGTSAERTPASLASPLTDISSDWKYKTEGMTDWSDFDIKKSWRYADDITGKFKLSKRFETSNDYKSPSIVLGIIRDRHRVYLNGNFIGGADRHTDLAMYTFDPRLLKAGSNEILVEAETERSLNPGLSMIPDVGTSLGEFSEISEKVRSNTIRFHVLRNVYFGLALTVLIGCFGFLIARRVPMNFVYSFSILLFSSLQLAYYSPWINETFDYPFVRFLKIAGLSLTALLLIPAYSRVYGWLKTEVVGNFTVLLFSAFSATLLFDGTIAPSVFTDRYNIVINIALAVSLPWLCIMAFQTVRRIAKSEERKELFPLSLGWLI